MNKIILTKELLYKEYIDNNKSIKQISDYNKMAPMTIYDAMIKWQLPIRKSKKFQIPRDILYIEYMENNKTMQEISDVFGCSFSVIQSLMKKYKIKDRIGQNTNKQAILTEEILKQLYLEDGLRIRQIATKLHISERYISDSLKQFNIQRKRAEKQLLNIDLLGKQYGRLTVLSLYDIKNHIWLCQCACGNTTKVGAVSLIGKNKTIKSCGCARASNANWKIIPPFAWNSIVKKATHRGLSVTISKEYAENLFIVQNKCCALSGIQLGFGRSRDKTSTTASLDRINSNLPYQEENIQWIHKTLNIAKHITPNDEFINWCKLIAEFNK